MRWLAATFVVIFTAYLFLMTVFTSYMHNKPFVEKLGYVPSPQVSKALAADHSQLLAALLTFQAIMYVGGVLEQQPEQKVEIPMDLKAMARLLRVSNALDPYNSDTYYFAQAMYIDTKPGAVFVNELLTRGMKYRTWDALLPFFAGFNAAFVLKDYRSAAELMKKAGEISGEPLYSSLAARFYNSAGDTDLAIKFMDLMERSSTDSKIRQLYHMRKQNLIAIKYIEEAVAAYRLRFFKVPHSLDELVNAGLLKKVPKPPLGEKYVISEDGRVESQRATNLQR